MAVQAGLIKPSVLASALQSSVRAINDVRLVGLDVSKSVIGIALSDASFTFATPLTTIKRSKFNSDADFLRLKDALSGHGHVGGIVIGWPLAFGGKMDESCFTVKKFADALIKYNPEWPVTLWDERGTSLQAKELIGQGRKKSQPYDNIAAMLMLQRYLVEHFPQAR